MMYHSSGYLHAIVDAGLIIPLNGVDVKLNCSKIRSKANDTETHQQQQKPLRLHQFVCTNFREELNVAENGAGFFIKNAVRVSAHHAILAGVVSVNGKVCKAGSAILESGDVVSLALEPQSLLMGDGGDAKLISWRGSEEVAKRLEDEGKHVSQRERDVCKRKGRMMTVMDVEDGCPSCTRKVRCAISPFIEYYRKKLGSSWIPEVHETAMLKPLPLTIRALKPSQRLDKELRDLGFHPVTVDDFSLNLCITRDNITHELEEPLNGAAVQQLVHNTWIIRDEALVQSKEKKQQLGVFLSDARISGEILQQELNSMLPVAVIASVLKNQACATKKKADTLLLDLCAAPGSKTCQLMSFLNEFMASKADEVPCKDYTVVANELTHQRATRMHSRLLQSNSKSLSHLIVTSGDGQEYRSMPKNYFDFVMCDVPCSGDGTIRKSPEKLNKWSLANAERNKPLQKELLRVGLMGLKLSEVDSSGKCIGGIAVYPTCSLNPTENEEVVYEVLDELNSDRGNDYEFELVDLRDSSSNITESNRNGSFLRVLPASSHGGFFAAALRKVNTRAKVVRTTCKAHTPNINDKLIWTQNECKNVGFAISPSTRQSCIDLDAKISSNSCIIGCGAPAMFKSSDGEYAFQEGCGLLNNDSLGSISSIQITTKQLTTYLCKRHNKIMLPKDLCPYKVENASSVILKVASSDKESNSTVYLPAKVQQSNEQLSRVFEITLRPQMLKRLLMTTLSA